MSQNKDIKPPKIIKNNGAIHPINQTKDYILEFLADLGFEIIEGPEIETEEFNFDMLNTQSGINNVTIAGVSPNSNVNESSVM